MYMRHAKCPSCGLRLVLSGPVAQMEFCPRCLARARRAVRMIDADPEPGNRGSEHGREEPACGP